MKNFRKVLRNVSEADYERFYKIPKYGEVRGKLRGTIYLLTLKEQNRGVSVNLDKYLSKPYIDEK